LFSILKHNSHNLLLLILLHFTFFHTPGFYFAMVQSLVMLEVYIEPGTRDVITVTRVVATIVGVLFAIVLQLIPPNVYGRYPKDIVPCLDEIKIVFRNTVDATLSLINEDEDEDDDKVASSDTNNNVQSPLAPTPSSLYEELIISGRQRECIENVQKVLNDRLFLAKDAGTLSSLPIMKLNPKIVPLLEDITITMDYITRLERISFGLKDNPDKHTLVKELCNVMKRGEPAPIHRRRSTTATHNMNLITAVIDGGDGGGDGGKITVLNSKELMNVLDGTSLLPGVTKLVENRLSDHERVLKSLL
jgi:tetrahydromethanopterin S-methyltransferase subunit F